MLTHGLLPFQTQILFNTFTGPCYVNNLRLIKEKPKLQQELPVLTGEKRPVPDRFLSQIQAACLMLQPSTFASSSSP